MGTLAGTREEEMRVTFTVDIVEMPDHPQETRWVVNVNNQTAGYEPSYSDAAHAACMKIARTLAGMHDG